MVRIHGIDSCSDGLDQDLVCSWFGDFEVVYYLPWSTRGFDNNAFHDYRNNGGLSYGLEDLAMTWIEESKSTSCIYLYVSDSPQPGAKAAASEA